MKTKTSFWAMLLLLVVMAIAVSTASAASPHFVRADADIDNDGNLVVSWKEAGLGDNELIDYAASADASGFYACINHGGKHPEASNKEDFQGPVSGAGTFASGRNGQITASLTVAPPESTLDCPGNQQLVLACVSYTDIMLADTTNGTDASIPDTLSAVFYAIDECAGF